MTNKEIETQINREMAAGKSRSGIWSGLTGTEEERFKFFFHLNNISPPRLRTKYQYLNLVICIVLAFLTFKKLLAAMAFGRFDIFLLMSLVVPVINLYVLREVMRFHRTGYRFLTILSALALLQPENHQAQEAIILILLIAGGGFMWFSLFPRGSLLPRSLIEGGDQP